MQESRFFNIYKPVNQSSNQTLMHFRRVSGYKKSGFAGTLDPFADGVLPIAVNKATKQIEEVLMQEKEYVFNIQFGFETDTGDITGNIINKNENYMEINRNDLYEISQSFVGNILQDVPIYSATKINGYRMCDLARNGVSMDFLKQEAAKKRRIVKIYSIEIENELSQMEYTIKVLCGKGTYIRQLAIDIGRKMNTFATVSKLTRTAVGDFEISDAIRLENFK